jgi:hypothetical protein
VPRASLAAVRHRPGGAADLDVAVNLTREALDLLQEGDPRRAGCLGVLAGT